MKNQSNHGLTKLIASPAYLLLRAGCRHFDYRLNHNLLEFTFGTTRYDHNNESQGGQSTQSYLKRFQFKQTTEEEFLQGVLLPHFDTIGQKRRKCLEQQYLNMTEADRTSYDEQNIGMITGLIAKLTDNKQEPTDQRDSWHKVNSVLWEIYSYLEAILVSTGYLKKLTTHYDSDSLVFEVQLLREGPYSFQMSLRGLSNFSDLARALFFCKYANDEKNLCQNILNDLYTMTENRLCRLDLKSDQTVVFLLTVAEDRLAFMSYALNSDDAPNRLYQLAQDIKNCPTITDIQDIDKIHEILYYANRTNSDFMLSMFPTLMQLAVKE